eukprot:m51a1_g9475 putative death-associated protein kinase 1 (1668) ;mRNA; f:585818-592505
MSTPREATVVEECSLLEIARVPYGAGDTLAALRTRVLSSVVPRTYPVPVLTSFVFLDPRGTPAGNESDGRAERYKRRRVGHPLVVSLAPWAARCDLPGAAAQLLDAASSATASTLGALIPLAAQCARSTAEELRARDAVGMTFAHHVAHVAAREGAEEAAVGVLCQVVATVPGATEALWVRDGHGQTALHVAANRGLAEVVAVLADWAGARESGFVDAVDINGDTAGHVAAARRRSNILDALRQAGANFDVPNRSGSTVWMIAHELMPELYDPASIVWSRTDVTPEELDLRAMAADPVAFPELGLTYMHLAAMARNARVLGLLLQNAGGMVECRDHSGRTPLHCLWERRAPMDTGCTRLLKMMCSETSLRAVDSAGRTPMLVALCNYAMTLLSVAAARGMLRVVQFLLLNGCLVPFGLAQCLRRKYSPRHSKKEIKSFVHQQRIYLVNPVVASLANKHSDVAILLATAGVNPEVPRGGVPVAWAAARMALETGDWSVYERLMGLIKCPVNPKRDGCYLLNYVCFVADDYEGVNAMMRCGVDREAFSVAAAVAQNVDSVALLLDTVYARHPEHLSAHGAHALRSMLERAHHRPLHPDQWDLPETEAFDAIAGLIISRMTPLSCNSDLARACHTVAIISRFWDLHTVSFLVSEFPGAVEFIRDVGSQTSLMSVAGGYANVLQVLNAADPAVSPLGLLVAVVWGQAECAQVLINRGIRATTASPLPNPLLVCLHLLALGRTPEPRLDRSPIKHVVSLSEALATSWRRIALMLVEAGADVSGQMNVREMVLWLSEIASRLRRCVPAMFVDTNVFLNYYAGPSVENPITSFWRGPAIKEYLQQTTSPLKEACRAGDIDLVQAILLKHQLGACRAGDLDVVQAILLKHQFGPVSLRDCMNYALHKPIAGEGDLASIVSTLLDRGADFGEETIQLAAAGGLWDVAERLICRQPLPCSVLPETLWAGAAAGRLDFVSTAVRRTSFSVKSIETAAKLAAGRGHTQILEALLLAHSGWVSGSEALHAACAAGNMEAVRLLLGSLGTDCDATDSQGLRPIVHACACGCVAAAKELISVGSFLSAECLAAALRRGKEDCALWVLNELKYFLPVELPVRNVSLLSYPQGTTAIHLAACGGLAEFTRKYLELTTTGLSSRDAAGYMPADYAYAMGHRGLGRLLEAASQVSSSVRKFAGPGTAVAVLSALCATRMSADELQEAVAFVSDSVGRAGVSLTASAPDSRLGNARSPLESAVSARNSQLVRQMLQQNPPTKTDESSLFAALGLACDMVSVDALVGALQSIGTPFTRPDWLTVVLRFTEVNPAGVPEALAHVDAAEELNETEQQSVTYVIGWAYALGQLRTLQAVIRIAGAQRVRELANDVVHILPKKAVALLILCGIIEDRVDMWEVRVAEGSGELMYTHDAFRTAINEISNGAHSGVVFPDKRSLADTVARRLEATTLPSLSQRLAPFAVRVDWPSFRAELPEELFCELASGLCSVPAVQAVAEPLQGVLSDPVMTRSLLRCVDTVLMVPNEMCSSRIETAGRNLRVPVKVGQGSFDIGDLSTWLEGLLHIEQYALVTAGEGEVPHVREYAEGLLGVTGVRVEVLWESFAGATEIGALWTRQNATDMVHRTFLSLRGTADLATVKRVVFFKGASSDCGETGLCGFGGLCCVFASE